MAGIDQTDIPVTVVGGYLGAGKTTLINHILRTADERIAVLVNDFGDINIDAALIESEDDNTISLANGCICCSLVDGFATAMMTVTDIVPSPERLVIEASGVADPAMVAAYAHGPGLRLDAVVVVVDSETIQKQARDVYVGDTILGQLRAGDIVLANKLDLVDDTHVESTIDWIREHAPGAAIVEARGAAIAPALLFGAVEAPAVPETLATPPAGATFHTWSWSSDQPVERERVEALMHVLPPEVVRAKGVVHLLREAGQRYALQRVGQRWQLDALEPATSNVANSASQLVVIATQPVIDDHWLERQLGTPEAST